MIEFEIIQKIKVKTIPEETIRKILLAEIQKQIPEAIVNGIEFVIKRNPTRVELEVDAQYGATEPVTMEKTEVKSSVAATQAGAVDETVTSSSKLADLPFDLPKVDKKEEVLNDLLTTPKVSKQPEPEVEKEVVTTDVADMFKL